MSALHQFEFQPGMKEISFFRMVIAAVRDGGFWVAPRTGQVYRVDKKAKTFTLLQETPDPDDWHSKTKACLAVLGWTVK